MNITGEDSTIPRELPSVTGGYPPLLAFKNKYPIVGDEKESQQYEFVCILFSIMVFFFFTAALVEKYKPKFGH